MPKKSKRNKLRGTLAWKKQQTTGDTSNATGKESVADCEESSVSDDELPQQQTASEKKLERSFSADHYEDNAYSYRYQQVSKILHTTSLNRT